MFETYQPLSANRISECVPTKVKQILFTYSQFWHSHGKEIIEQQKNEVRTANGTNGKKNEMYARTSVDVSIAFHRQMPRHELTQSIKQIKFAQLENSSE